MLRAEKGYIIVGQDTDGTVTPDDAGLGWAIGKSKPDFVGKRSLARPAMSAPRPQAAGRPAHRGSAGGARGGRADRRRRRRAGADADRSATSPPPTGAPRSAARSRWRLVAGGRARIGQTLYVATARGEVAVEVTATVFYDPSGARIHG